MVVELTEEEVNVIDQRMNDHMYHHTTISNNINGMSCDYQCRTSSLRMFINDALRLKQIKLSEGCCIHGRTKDEHPGCYDQEGMPT